MKVSSISSATKSVQLPVHHGVMATTASIVRNEGFFSLYNGLMPGLHRSFLFGGIRVGFYYPIRDAFCGDAAKPALYQKIAAAMATGAIGISVANPTDVVKVRL